MKTTTIKNQDLYLTSGGKEAILRYALPDITKKEISLVNHELGGLENVAQASMNDLISVMRYPFPWGYKSENKNPTEMWKKYKMGLGGMIHNRWFVANEGRIGGAAENDNVRDVGPDALRYYCLLDGGQNVDTDTLNENEGFALKLTNIAKINQHIYRMIHLRVAKNIGPDGGGVIICPVSNEEETVYVGFTGRCMTCPNPEMITIEALKAAMVGLIKNPIMLHPDWEQWRI